MKELEKYLTLLTLPCLKMVGATGFEPATSCSQSKCSSQAELRSDTRSKIA